MAQIFNRALARPGSVEEMIMAELQRQPEPEKPMFTPEQIRQRVMANNQMLNAGVVGQLSGLEDVQGVGGQVFKKALGDRAERVTDRGVTDTLTGETAIDPEWQRMRDEDRRGRVLKQALDFENNRRQSQERMAEIRARTSQGRTTDSELIELRKDLLRAQIGATQGREARAGDKIESAANTRKVAADAAVQRANLMLGTVDKALDQTGGFTTGLPGSVIARVPGTTAFDLRKTIDTLKANIGFAELAAMRQASPTGGALGQVAVRELDMLQATLGNLDANQSEDQTKENLQQIRKHYQNWLETMQQAGSETDQPRSVGPGTEVGSPAPAPIQPTPGSAPVSATPRGASTPPRRLRLDPTTGKLVPVQ
jgi:hypothetical protein